LQAVKDLSEGIASIKRMLEEGPRDVEQCLPAAVLEMAGMSKLTPRHVRENSGPLYGDFTPAAFKGDHPLLLQKLRLSRVVIYFFLGTEGWWASQACGFSLVKISPCKGLKTVSPQSECSSKLLACDDVGMTEGVDISNL